MGVRFYVDADMLGLAQVLAGLREDVTFPGDPGDPTLGRPACALEPASLDRHWLPAVARNNWVVLTRDRHLKHRPAEKQAIIDNSARVVQLVGSQAVTTWTQLETVMTQWRKIEGLMDLPGPWVYRLGRTTLVKEALVGI